MSDEGERLRQVVEAPLRADPGRRFLRSTLGRLLRFPRFVGRRMRVFALGLVIVVLSVTTCSFGVDAASLTAPYGDPVPASADAAIRFAEKGAAAMEALAGTHTIRLAITETEATSALSVGMMLPALMRTMGRIPVEEIRGATDLVALRERLWLEEAAARDSLLSTLPLPYRLMEKLDPRVRTGDVQVRFQESGQVVVAGYVQAWRFRQPMMFVVAPSARSGELELDFVEGRLGRLPAPAFVFDLVGELIARAVLLGREYAEVTELTVAPGELRFLGRVQP
jgi:hypothetical protein